MAANKHRRQFFAQEEFSTTPSPQNPKDFTSFYSNIYLKSESYMTNIQDSLVNPVPILPQTDGCSWQFVDKTTFKTKADILDCLKIQPSTENITLPNQYLSYMEANNNNHNSAIRIIEVKPTKPFHKCLFGSLCDLFLVQQYPIDKAVNPSPPPPPQELPPQQPPVPVVEKPQKQVQFAQHEVQQPIITIDSDEEKDVAKTSLPQKSILSKQVPSSKAISTSPPTPPSIAILKGEEEIHEKKKSLVDSVPPKPEQIQGISHQNILNQQNKVNQQQNQGSIINANENNIARQQEQEVNPNPQINQPNHAVLSIPPQVPQNQNQYQVAQMEQAAEASRKVQQMTQAKEQQVMQMKAYLEQQYQELQIKQVQFMANQANVRQRFEFLQQNLNDKMQLLHRAELFTNQQQQEIMQLKANTMQLEESHRNIIEAKEVIGKQCSNLEEENSKQRIHIGVLIKKIKKDYKVKKQLKADLLKQEKQNCKTLRDKKKAATALMIKQSSLIVSLKSSISELKKSLNLSQIAIQNQSVPEKCVEEKQIESNQVESLDHAFQQFPYNLIMEQEKEADHSNEGIQQSSNDKILEGTKRDGIHASQSGLIQQQIVAYQNNIISSNQVNEYQQNIRKDTQRSAGAVTYEVSRQPNVGIERILGENWAENMTDIDKEQGDSEKSYDLLENNSAVEQGFREYQVNAKEISHQQQQKLDQFREAIRPSQEMEVEQPQTSFYSRWNHRSSNSQEQKTI